jgi:hypothetical protein
MDIRRHKVLEPEGRLTRSGIKESKRGFQLHAVRYEALCIQRAPLAVTRAIIGTAAYVVKPLNIVSVRREFIGL